MKVSGIVDDVAKYIVSVISVLVPSRYEGLPFSRRLTTLQHVRALGLDVKRGRALRAAGHRIATVRVGT
jgi:hypothetical protein